MYIRAAQKPYGRLNMNRRKDKVFIMLIVSIILSLVCSFVAYLGSREKAESLKLVIDTYQAINASSRLMSLVTDMETGYRGYVITGDSAFLDPYIEANGLIPGETKKLRTAVAENDQQERFFNNRIAPAIESWKNLSTDRVKMHYRHGKDSSSRWIAAQVGKDLDTIRLLMTTFEQNERASLASHEAVLERNAKIEQVIQFSSFGLIALTCTLAFLRLSRELQKISSLVDKLEDANATLEQKVLTRTRQLSEANEAKDHFLGIASHDLKAPIAGVQGLIQLMRLENKDRSEPDTTYLNYMEDACKSMLVLITNLLDINRINRGEVPFHKEPVSVKELLKRIEKGFSAQATKKGIPFQVESKELTIQTDPANLSRILENLVSNALKFSSMGQAVIVNTSRDDHSVTFTVTDHGPGIPSDEIPLLFKKFSHLSNRPTGGEGSSGLGLAIVHELTELAGGSLHVVSTRGVGSQFSVRLPLA